jgi:hypothetical protein
VRLFYGDILQQIHSKETFIIASSEEKLITEGEIPDLLISYLVFIQNKN